MKAAVSTELWVLRLYGRSTRNPWHLWSLARARWLNRSRTITVRAPAVGKLAVRGGTTDMAVVGEVLAGAYDAALGTLPARGLMVDLGAHIGAVARAALERQPYLTVVAVEANDDNVPLLRRNVPEAKIIARPVAATHRKVGLTAERLDGCRITDAGELDTVTMDDIPGFIDLLKVDIEGAEEELFADCQGWIGRVGVIVCECHHPYTAERLIEAVGGEVLDLQPLPQFGYDLVTLSL